MSDRTPIEIVGEDALRQLLFEGYVVVPIEPTPTMREVGGQANCPTESLTSACDYAVEVYKMMTLEGMTK